MLLVGAGAFDRQKRASQQGLIASERSGRLFGKAMEGQGVHLHQFIEGEGDWTDFHHPIVIDIHAFLSNFVAAKNRLNKGATELLSIGSIRKQ